MRPRALIQFCVRAFAASTSKTCGSYHEREYSPGTRRTRNSVIRGTRRLAAIPVHLAMRRPACLMVQYLVGYWWYPVMIGIISSETYIPFVIYDVELECAPFM